MEKKSFANRFGLVALMSLSLFASTAFAGNAPAPTQVVVTNTPAQPVPMVGLTKDSDAPARKPFQWNGTFNQYASAGSGLCPEPSFVFSSCRRHFSPSDQFWLDLAPVQVRAKAQNKKRRNSNGKEKFRQSFWARCSDVSGPVRLNRRLR